MRRLLHIALLLTAFPFMSPAWAGADELSTLAIQHSGRIQSFEGFSRKILRLVSNKESFEGLSAKNFMFSLLLEPEKARTIRWIRVDHLELKVKLHMEADRRFFSLEEIWPQRETLLHLAGLCQEARDRDERPSPLLQAAETLTARAQTVHEASTRTLFTIAPPETPNSPWVWPAEGSTPSFTAVLEARKQNPSNLPRALADWNHAILRQSAETRNAHLIQESLYFRLKPFAAAWAAYLLGAVLSVTLLRKKNVFSTSALSSIFVLAFVCHSAGLILRVLILKRPPVSNMYESMIFMTWAAVAFSGLFAAIYRNRTPLIASSTLSGFVLIYANLLPIDPGLDVLVPVLRSNYWLSIHVLTVVSSYGAFGLAAALGHRHLALRALGRLTAVDETASALVIRRVMEVGAILIGIGTVLGGIWANESWGRFWGWDPKETWALITLLGYLIIVHLWYFKRIGAFGLAIGSVLGFILVLMTWYGVNFLLGRGLHSYGSGQGGAQWVAAYLAAEVVFLGWVLASKSCFKR